MSAPYEDWANVASPVLQIIGGQWQITLPADDSGAQFFRLTK